MVDNFGFVYLLKYPTLALADHVFEEIDNEYSEWLSAEEEE
jgi:hypothetical protein